MRVSALCSAVVLAACSTVTQPYASAAEKGETLRAETISAGSRYLTEIGQAEDGSFSAEVGPAVTALAITGLLRTGTPADAEVVRRGIDYLLSFSQPTGGIHPADSPYANYETSIAVMVLVVMAVAVVVVVLVVVVMGDDDGRDCGGSRRRDGGCGCCGSGRNGW